MDNQGGENQPRCRRIALGLTDHLEPFSDRMAAEDWRQFAAEDFLSWRFTFLEIADDPGTLIFFNLHGVDVWLGLMRIGTGRRYTPTDWELFQIREHPNWWPRIEWWDDKTRVSNPFEGEPEP